MLSILSFDANDPSLNHVVSSKNGVQNKVGLFGAYASGFLNDVFGVAALLWPLVFAAIGAAYISANYCFHWWRWCGFFLLTICFLVLGSSWDISVGDLSGGGMVGSTLYKNSSHYLSPVGSFILWTFIFLIGLQLAFNFSWISLGEKLAARIKSRLAPEKSGDKACEPDKRKRRLPDLSGFFNCGRFGKFSDFAKTKLGEISGALRQKISELSSRKREEPKAEVKEAPDPVFVHNIGATPDILPEHVESAPENDVRLKDIAPDISKESEKLRKTEETVKIVPPPPPLEKRPIPVKKGETELPSLDLLTPAKAEGGKISRDVLESKGKKLITCLGDFDIQGELVRITPGPVVTMFEIRPAPGIRVSKIANLSDDLGRALRALAVRIQAPIPGSDTVGIEIPNEHRELVNFRELAESSAFANGCGPLTMILGKDIAGKPYLADLSKMPHLLVAGATGQGKSVCLNCILISFLYRLKPENMQLLLVDPKRIEMSLYADSPHLVHPVVTEMDDAKNALDWAVHEMDRRYQAIARLGVRDVASYNQKMASFKGNVPQIFEDLQPLPYLVIVIDELADLMMTASREVEQSIVRLAQLARAAGIHMILATQRPSVDVVTGLIKANFPCRISFQVTSKHDSRTILDDVGAEHLLGKGDMIFKPSGGRTVRLHGAFLSSEECAAVVEHWKSQQAPDYKIDFTNWSADANAGQVESGIDARSDPLYENARNFVLDHGQASISLLQRQFRIGFNRAGRIMAQFEKEGLIGPAEGSKPRQVIAK